MSKLTDKLSASLQSPSAAKTPAETPAKTPAETAAKTPAARRTTTRSPRGADPVQQTTAAPPTAMQQPLHPTRIWPD